MKRSRSVPLVLLGSLAAGALAAPAAGAAVPRITPQTWLPNDLHLPGVGYYHAPFQAFYPHPYNHFDPRRKQYFFGGTWADAPHGSIVNLSTPHPDAARRAEALRTDVRRGGFGSTGSRSYFSGS